MYLERLEIQGFKSFANKNKLIFPGLIDKKKRGITAIVGPNGSGKSNVADSVRWALGEQSLKTLRGKKSEDVIFSGSDKKGQLNMAEVSLCLNNETGHIDFANLNKEAQGAEGEGAREISKDNQNINLLLKQPEIILTRRLFRNGESEYLINNTRARLTDIQMLLAKASFGQKTYSVIGQGMVEGFLNTSLSERKDFFDEATGVKQYQIKRDISLNKLEGSYENLEQVDMLLQEIEPRLRSLTRQVDKLRKRADIEENLLALQLNYFRSLWHELNDKFNDYNQKYLDLEQDKFSKEDKLASLNLDLNKIESQPSVNEEFVSLQEKLSDLNQKRENCSRQLSRLEAWFNLQQEKRSDNNASAIVKDREALFDKLRLVEERIAAQSAATSGANNLEEKQVELNNLQKDKEAIEKELNRLNVYLEMKLESQGDFDLSFLNNRRQEINKEAQNLKEELLESEAELNRSRLEQEKVLTERNALSDKLKVLNSELMGLSLELGSKEIEKINDKLRQSLARLEEAENHFELDKIKSLVLEIRQEIKAILALSSGEDNRLRLEKIQQEISRLTGEKERLADRADELHKSLTSQEEKIKISKQRQGDLERELSALEKKLSQSQEKADLGEMKKEQLDLEKQRDLLNEKINLLKTEIISVRQATEKKREELFALQKEAQGYQMEIARLDSSLGSLRVEEAKYEARREDLESAIKQKALHTKLLEISQPLLEEERALNAKALAELEKEISSIQEKIGRFNSEQEEKRNQLLTLQKNIQSLQYEINGLNGELNDLKVSSARQETKLEELENNIRNDKLDLAQVKNERFEGELDLEQAREDIFRYKNQLEMIGGIDPEIEKEYSETKERYDFLSGQTEDLEKTIKSLEKIIYELDVTIKDRFDKEFKIISEKFTEYFKILFNGGSAKIVKVMAEEEGKTSEETLEEVENKSEEKTLAAPNKLKYLRKYNATGLAGIEIEATPPGKKIKSISMLSGGERALTAIALICAIISANPSPFVVLDEVDAALDEANSERLAKILDDLSDKTQFIVITHNRASMRKASVLYGITMQADGVSQILSVKLEDVKVD